MTDRIDVLTIYHYIWNVKFNYYRKKEILMYDHKGFQKLISKKKNIKVWSQSVLYLYIRNIDTMLKEYYAMMRNDVLEEDNLYRCLCNYGYSSWFFVYPRCLIFLLYELVMNISTLFDYPSKIPPFLFAISFVPLCFYSLSLLHLACASLLKIY